MRISVKTLNLQPHQLEALGIASQHAQTVGILLSVVGLALVLATKGLRGICEGREVDLGGL